MSRSKGQGSISLRKDGLYMGRITKNGVTKTFYGKDKNYVEYKMLEYSYNSDVCKVLKFSDYVHDYLYTYKYKHIKDSSFDRLESVYRNHIETSTIGSLSLSVLEDVVIQQFLNEKAASGLSFSSVKKIFDMIRGVLFYAYKKGDLATDFSSLLRMPSDSCFKDVKHIDVYSPAEYIKLRDYILSDCSDRVKERRFLRYAPVYIFMFHTGLRAGEMLALTWSDVDFKKKQIHITRSVSLIKNRTGTGTKNKSVISTVKTSASKRIVPLNDVALQCLLELKVRYSFFDCMCDFVVCNMHSEFIRLRSFEAKFEKICNRVGVPYKGIHAIRHTFASNLIDKGVSPKVVSDLLGHTNVAFTLNRYVHPDGVQKSLSVSLLE